MEKISKWMLFLNGTITLPAIKELEFTIFIFANLHLKPLTANFQLNNLWNNYKFIAGLYFTILFIGSSKSSTSCTVYPQNYIV